MNAKDRSMICRMAGNIVGPLLAEDERRNEDRYIDKKDVERWVALSVSAAVAIVSDVDALIDSEKNGD